MGRATPQQIAKQSKGVWGPYNLCTPDLFNSPLSNSSGIYEVERKMEGLGWQRQNPITPTTGFSRALEGAGKDAWEGETHPRPEMSLNRPKGRVPTGWDPWQGLCVSFPLTLAPVSSTELFPARKTGMNEN